MEYTGFAVSNETVPTCAHGPAVSVPVVVQWRTFVVVMFESSAVQMDVEFSKVNVHGLRVVLEATPTNPVVVAC